MQIIFDSDEERRAYITEMCYGTAQGIKLATAKGTFKRGQHTEAMRDSWVRHVRFHPEDVIDDAERALANAGYNVDFRQGRNEGGKP